MVEGAAGFTGQEAQVKKLGSKNPEPQHARSDIAATFGWRLWSWAGETVYVVDKKVRKRRERWDSRNEK